MTDDPNDTLTTIEAKVLCMRYGIKNIDASNSVKTLQNHHIKELSPSISISVVAKELDSDKDTVKHTEQIALKKLHITT